MKSQFSDCFWSSYLTPYSLNLDRARTGKHILISVTNQQARTQADNERQARKHKIKGSNDGCHYSSNRSRSALRAASTSPQPKEQTERLMKHRNGETSISTAQAQRGVNTSLKSNVFYRLVHHFGTPNSSKIDQESIKIAPKSTTNRSKWSAGDLMGPKLAKASIFDRFGSLFGHPLGTFGERFGLPEAYF